MHIEKKNICIVMLFTLALILLERSWSHCRQLLYNTNSAISNSHKYEGLVEKECQKQKLSLFDAFLP